jgi:hypothetical protein
VRGTLGQASAEFTADEYEHESDDAAEAGRRDRPEMQTGGA